MLTVSKDSPKSDDFWANMPLDDLAFGNAMDCDFTLRAYYELKDKMSKKGVDKVYTNLLKDILVILGEVENTGIRVDEEYLVELDKILFDELTNLFNKINQLSPTNYEVNPNSNEEMAGVLFTSDGFDLMPIMFSEKTKMPQISEEHLTKILGSTKDEKAKEFIKTLLKYKYRCKQYRTYVKGIEKALQYNEDGRIYSLYNFATVVTGRLSCSAYSIKKSGKIIKKGVSFHTLPRESSSDFVNIRKLMRADEGKVFLAADFSQAELRVLAQCCKDDNIIKAFNSGEDLHRFTASLVFGKPPDKVTKEERQIAKSVSFLIIYGGGVNKLSQQIGKPINYCKGIFKAYENAFPKVFDWIRETHESIRRNGFAVSLFGRHRHLPNINSPIKQHQFRSLRQGMNFVIQSSASDLMLHAIKRLYCVSKRLGLELDILATVHDSVEIQCAPEDVFRAASMLKLILPTTSDLKSIYGIDFVVPFEVDVEVGTSFGRLCEAKFDSTGRVINGKEIQSFLQNA